MLLKKHFFFFVALFIFYISNLSAQLSNFKGDHGWHQKIGEKYSVSDTAKLYYNQKNVTRFFKVTGQQQNRFSRLFAESGIEAMFINYTLLGFKFGTAAYYKQLYSPIDKSEYSKDCTEPLPFGFKLNSTISEVEAIIGNFTLGKHRYYKNNKSLEVIEIMDLPGYDGLAITFEFLDNKLQALEVMTYDIGDWNKNKKNYDVSDAFFKKSIASYRDMAGKIRLNEMELFFKQAFNDSKNNVPIINSNQTVAQIKNYFNPDSVVYDKSPLGNSLKIIWCVDKSDYKEDFFKRLDHYCNALLNPKYSKLQSNVMVVAPYLVNNYTGKNETWFYHSNDKNTYKYFNEKPIVHIYYQLPLNEIILEVIEGAGAHPIQNIAGNDWLFLIGEKINSPHIQQLISQLGLISETSETYKFKQLGLTIYVKDGIIYYVNFNKDSYLGNLPGSIDFDSDLSEVKNKLTKTYDHNDFGSLTNEEGLEATVYWYKKDYIQSISYEWKNYGSVSIEVYNQSKIKKGYKCPVLFQGDTTLKYNRNNKINYRLCKPINNEFVVSDDEYKIKHNITSSPAINPSYKQCVGDAFLLALGEAVGSDFLKQNFSGVPISNGEYLFASKYFYTSTDAMGNKYISGIKLKPASYNNIIAPFNLKEGMSVGEIKKRLPGFALPSGEKLSDDAERLKHNYIICDNMGYDIVLVFRKKKLIEIEIALSEKINTRSYNLQKSSVLPAFDKSILGN